MSSHTEREIFEQPEAWQQTLDYFQKHKPEIKNFFQQFRNWQWLFIGCGSSYHIAISASFYFRWLLGVESYALPASEVIFYPSAWRIQASTIAVGISRSGETTETMEALRRLASRYHVPTVAITSSAESPMAREATFSIALPHLAEKSVVMTKSFSSLLLGLQLLAHLISDQMIPEKFSLFPEYGEKMITHNSEIFQRIVQDSVPKQLVFLGQGGLYGIAAEGMLKAQEMSLTPASAYHSLEYRHGPKSLIEEGFMVINLSSRAAWTHEQKLLQEMKELGARVVYVGELVSENPADETFLLEPGIPDEKRWVLYAPFIQLLALKIAQHKNLDPDKPRHLTQVVKL